MQISFYLFLNAAQRCNLSQLRKVVGELGKLSMLFKSLYNYSKSFAAFVFGSIEVVDWESLTDG